MILGVIIIMIMIMFVIISSISSRTSNKQWFCFTSITSVQYRHIGKTL